MGDQEQVVFAEICRIAASEIDRPTISMGDRLVEDLQLDSLEMTVIAVGLEDHFRIKLSEHDATGLVTVGDLCSLVASRIREATP